MPHTRRKQKESEGPADGVDLDIDQLTLTIKTQLNLNTEKSQTFSVGNLLHRLRLEDEVLREKEDQTKQAPTSQNSNVFRNTSNSHKTRYSTEISFRCELCSGFHRNLKCPALEKTCFSCKHKNHFRGSKICGGARKDQLNVDIKIKTETKVRDVENLFHPRLFDPQEKREKRFLHNLFETRQKALKQL